MIGHDFPYLDTRDLNLDWLIKNMKQILLDWAEYQKTMNQSFANLESANAAFKRDMTAAFNNLHDFVDDYFDNLNVQTEINNKLDAMRRSGELAAIMAPLIATEASAWLEEHITNPTNPPIDTSLTVAGAAADAKATGGEITILKKRASQGEDNIYDLQSAVLQKNIAYLTTEKLKTRIFIPAGSTIIIESDTGFSVANQINFYDQAGTQTEYKSISQGGKITSYKAVNDIYYAAMYYQDAEPIKIYYVTSTEGIEAKIAALTARPLANAIRTANIFSGWEVGGLDYSTGIETPDIDTLRSIGYIEVTPSTLYRIDDPERISATARNAQYLDEYDDKYRFIRYTVITTAATFTTAANTKYIRFRSQVVGTNNYIIGDYTNYKTFLHKDGDIIAYEPPGAIAIGIDIENTEYPMAIGEMSKNLFSGKWVNGYFGSSGEIIADNTILASPFIPASNTVYWQLFGGKKSDIQYIFEYDENKSFVRSSTIPAGNTVAGKMVLDSATRFIRFRTQTASASYTLPDVNFLNSHFVVSGEPIERFISVKPNVSSQNVDNDFYDTAVQFVGFEYNKTAADEYIKTIKESGYDVVIPFITDTHTEQPQPYDLHNYIAASGVADLAFNLGDNIPSNYDTKAKAIQTLNLVFHEEYLNPRKCEVYVLCGNHDYNPHGNNAAEYTVNPALYYSLSQARTKKGYAYSNKNYGYVDLNAAKVRVIWLDSGDIFNDDGTVVTTAENTAVRQEQFTWFCDVALDFSDKADRSDWNVMTMSHDSLSALSDGGFATVIKAFMDGTSASGVAHCVGRGSDIPQAYNVDFTQQGGINYLCHICGHQHYDRISELGTTGRYQIWIACDNIDQGAGDYNGGNITPYTRTRGTIEERLIDTFCLDKKTRKITMKRLGIGTDRSVTY